MSVNFETDPWVLASEGGDKQWFDETGMCGGCGEDCGCGGCKGAICFACQNRRDQGYGCPPGCAGEHVHADGGHVSRATIVMPDTTENNHRGRTEPMTTTEAAPAKAKRTNVKGEARKKLAAEVAAEYGKDGASVRSVAEAKGLSFGLVHRLLGEHGVVMRSRGGRVKS